MRENSWIMPRPTYSWIRDEPRRGSTSEVTTLISVESTIASPTTAAIHSTTGIRASSPNAHLARRRAPGCVRNLGRGGYHSTHSPGAVRHTDVSGAPAKTGPKWSKPSERS